MTIRDLHQGDIIYSVVISPMEENFPIVMTPYIVDRVNLRNSFAMVMNMVTNTWEDKSLRNFDYGITAQSQNRVYIWLSDRDSHKAYRIVKEYYDERLQKLLKETKKLETIFANMEARENRCGFNNLERNQH